MFNFISLLQSIYNYINVSPLSIITGIIIGSIIGFSVRIPKSGKSIIGLFILIILSPKIGRNVYLVKTIDMNIMLSSLIFVTTLTVLIILLYRSYKFDQIPYSKENK